MKSLFTFESSRFWRSQKTALVLAVFLIALIGMIIYNVRMDNTYWANQHGALRTEKMVITNTSKSLENQIESLERSLAEDSDLEEAFESLEELKSHYRFIRRQYLYNYQQELMARAYDREEVDAQTRLELWVERDQHMLDGLKRGHTLPNQTITLVTQRLSANQYLLEQGIEPLHSPYQMTGTNFLYQLTTYPWMLIILMAMAFMTIDMFSGDFEGGFFKVLFSQPFGRGKIFTVKYLVRFSNSFLVITGIVLLAFAVISIFNGLGDTSYPALYYNESFQGIAVNADSGVDTYTFLNWSDYMLRVFPLYFLICFLIVSMVGTASLFLNSSANVVNFLFCLLVLDFIARTLFSLNDKFFMFWPFAAAAINEVLQGQFTLSAVGYIIIHSSLASVFLLASLIILSKRDLTGGVGS